MYGLFPINPPELVETEAGTIRLTMLCRALVVSPLSTRPIVVRESKGYLVSVPSRRGELAFRAHGQAVEYSLDKDGCAAFVDAHGTDFSVQKIRAVIDSEAARKLAAKAVLPE